jgi:CheY-like chemotaxis protein
VLVSDIGMPDEDGYSFMQRVKALARTEGGGIPALALTAYTRPQDRERALAAGFSAHLGKPVDADQLVREVSSLVSLQKRTKTV